MRLPLYPAWLSFAAGGGLAAAKSARAVAATLSIPAAFFLAAELAGPWAGALAACALVLPGIKDGTADLTLEPFYGWTLTLLVLALARWRRRGGTADAVAAAAAFAFAASTRSTILPALPAAALLAAWGLGARETLRRGAVLAAAAALAVVPWALRNRAVYGHALPFEGAGSALAAWGAAAGRDSAVSDFVDVNRVSEEARAGLRRGRELDDARRASVVLDSARERAAAAPAAYAAGAVRRLPLLWSADWPWLAGGLAAFATPAGGVTAGLALLPAAALSLHAAGSVRARYARPAVPALAALLCAGLAALALKNKAKPERLDREAGLYLAACLLLLGASWARGARALWAERRAGAAPEVPIAWATRAEAWRGAKLAHDRGVALALNGEWRLARGAFDAVLASEPDFPESLVSRGLLLDRIASPEEAERDLARARRLIESR